MRVTHKEIKKPNSERVRYSLTELTQVEFEAICKGLEMLKDDKEAAALLNTLQGIASA